MSNFALPTARKAVSLFLLVPLFLSLPAFRSDVPEWTEVTLNNTLNVRFPGQPSFQTVQNIPFYGLRTGEAIYTAMYIDQKSSPHYKPIADAPSLHSFYLGFMDSVLRNFKSTLTDTTSFYLGSRRGMDFRYTTTGADGATLTRRNRVILLDDIIYSLSVTPVVLPTDESRGTEKLFLESLQTKKQ